jgi:hypothetical protein
MKSSTTASASLPARTGAQARLYSRPGNDLMLRFPLIVETLAPTISPRQEKAPYRSLNAR